ncbi:hypothetical protein HZ326_28776 [Fusarium oxysporum f. sp. albedinis]|nr:hypothetical protein HZ326_28776 [Fusarium oxysporum f. sp. albedinis]
MQMGCLRRSVIPSASMARRSLDCQGFSCWTSILFPFRTYVITRGRSSVVLQLSTGTYVLYPGCVLILHFPSIETQGSWTRIISAFCTQHSCRNAVCCADPFPTFPCAMCRGAFAVWRSRRRPVLSLLPICVLSLVPEARPQMAQCPCLYLWRPPPRLSFQLAGLGLCARIEGSFRRTGWCGSPGIQGYAVRKGLTGCKNEMIHVWVSCSGFVVGSGICLEGRALLGLCATAYVYQVSGVSSFVAFKCLPTRSFFARILALVAWSLGRIASPVAILCVVGQSLYMPLSRLGAHPGSVRRYGDPQSSSQSHVGLASGVAHVSSVLAVSHRSAGLFGPRFSRRGLGTGRLGYCLELATSLRTVRVALRRLSCSPRTWMSESVAVFAWAWIEASSPVCISVALWDLPVVRNRSSLAIGVGCVCRALFCAGWLGVGELRMIGAPLTVISWWVEFRRFDVPAAASGSVSMTGSWSDGFADLGGC